MSFYVEITHEYPTTYETKENINKASYCVLQKGGSSSLNKIYAPRGAQDVMELAGTSSFPIREFASLVHQFDPHHLQSMTQARIQNVVVLSPGSRLGCALQTGSWTTRCWGLVVPLTMNCLPGPLHRTMAQHRQSALAGASRR